MPDTFPPRPPTMPSDASPSSAYASWGRRILAIFIDWFACLGVSQVLVLTVFAGKEPPGVNFYTLALFFLESAIGVAVLGGSFGQLLTRLRVRRLDGRPVELLPSMLRSLLVCLVIPPLVFRPDGRGLHDLAVGTATFTLVAPVG